MTTSKSSSHSKLNEGKQDIQNLIEQTDNYVLNITKRIPLAFVRGEGSYLFDKTGRPYLDFICGVGVNSLGHAHPRIRAVIEEQSKKLLHISNLFYIPEQSQLAEMLIKKTSPGKAFFFNSGTEANEAAFKLCRRYGQEAKQGASIILSLKNSFHGRTSASMCLTGQDKIHNGFGPLISEHQYIAANDISALQKKLTSSYGKKICALFIELIQGEAGVHPLNKEYVLQVRKLCSEHKVILVIDEVQTGIGRTGKLFCYENYNVKADIITLGKALGAGISISAIIAYNETSSYLQPGEHGTTTGGNPFASRIAQEVIHIIEKEKLLDNVTQLSDYLFSRLNNIQSQAIKKGFEHSLIENIRGIGFHIALDLKCSALEFIELCRHKGLLLNATSSKTVRIMPPLNISQNEIDKGIAIMEESFLALENKLTKKIE